MLLCFLKCIALLISRSASMSARSKALCGQAAWIVVVQASALLQGAMQPLAEPLQPEWYNNLDKPTWVPPPWLFPLMWIPLKLLQTVASAYLWDLNDLRVFTSPSIMLFVLHLSLGDVWNVQFFLKRRILTGLLTITAFWLVLASATVSFFRSNMLAGALLAPSVAWVAVAATLNLDVWYLNR